MTDEQTPKGLGGPAVIQGIGIESSGHPDAPEGEVVATTPESGKDE
jgi:hypothetical protein